MKKIFNKFTKILLLVAMVISDLMTPIKVFAAEGEAVTPKKGDVGINETVSNEGSVTVTKGSIENPGDVMVTKTVKKNGEGKFTVEFEVKGKDAESTTTVVKPVYVVIVLDTSGSMICDADNGSYAFDNSFSAGWDSRSYTAADGETIYCSNARYHSDYILTDKWENAVSGAVTFSENLADLDNTYASVVTFASTATTATAFAHGALSESDFSHPVGGTNLEQGLSNAKSALDGITDANAQKYIVLIGDGEPTFYGSGIKDNDGYDNYPTATSNAKTTADNIKNSGINIFTIGYGIDNNTNAQNILKYVSSNTDAQGTYTDNGYYQSANSSGIAGTLQTVFNQLSTSIAGTGATLTDNIGSSFSVDASSSDLITVVGSSVSNTDKFDITEDVTKISFDVEINGDEADGWVNVNEGFTLTYTDYNGEEKTITYGSDEPQPQVYWERNTYNYVINYYKDEVTNTSDSEHYLGTSGNLSAFNGETITLTDEQKNAHIITGYELSSSNVYTITIDKTKDNIINVLYTLKKFDYNVNYYYDGIKDNDKSYTESDVTYGTVVNANELYFANTDEYSLDTENSTSGNVTINNNGITIDIYYIKNSYRYEVHYNFNGNEDTDFAKNPAALYGTELFAGDFYLTSSELATNYSDYFLEPGNSKNTETITVGNKENRLDIYYVNTNFSNNESITKSATTNGNKVTSSNQVVNYKINYSDVINNVRGGDTVTVTLVDTLPFKGTVTGLTEGCSYDNDKTITCTITKTADKFESHYEVSEEVEYSVVYEDFADISASSNPKLVNTVNGKTTVTSGNIVKESAGVEATAEVPVEISGNLIVHHYTKDEEGNNVSVYSDERSSALVGSDYETNYRTDIIGYTVDTDSIPSNKDGKYAVNDTEVTYYYVKKDGVIDNPTTVKSFVREEGQTENIVESVNSTFNYTITGTATIKDYIGTYKVRATDYLPYKLDTTDMEKLDENDNIYKVNDKCVYDGNMTIVCESETKNITKDMYDSNKEYSVSETFELSIKYLNITNETVTNRAKIEVILDNNSKPSETTTEDVTVKEGSVKAVYLENGKETNVLEEEYTNTGLVGTNYETPFKPVFGYTLDKDPENKNGSYVEGETLVKYLYNKNKGTFVEEPTAEKNGPDSVASINSEFEYTITGSASIKDYVGTYKVKVVDTLPYSIDTEKSTLDNRCTYDGNNTITCVSEEKTVAESDYVITEAGEKVFNIKETFTLSLVYVGIKTESVKNSAKVEIILDDNSKESPVDTAETEIKKGTVKATYNTTDGEELADAVTTTGIGGSEYTTEAKEFFGYHLKEAKGYTTGTYVAEKEILVEYIYELNDGEITNNKVTKEGPEIISDVNDYTEYVFTYDGTVKDYIGKATLTLTDVLPYEIYSAGYDDRCDYDFENNTFTCKVEYDITEEDYVNGEYNIHEEFYLDVIYGELDSDVITNKVDSKLELRKVYKDSESSVDSKVLKGELLVSYVDEEGNVLDSYTITDYAGLYYETEEREFDGYTFKSNSDNVEGFLIANETIYVEYVYSKNVGTYEELPPQTGVEDISVNYIGYVLAAFLFILLGKKKEVKNN